MTLHHPRSAAARHRGRLAIVLAVTSGILVAEVVGAVVSGSLALVADAGHMFTDAAGIGLSLLAIWFGGRPATSDRTFGYYRLEILAAVVNAVLLFGVGGFVLVEGIRRIVSPLHVGSGLMLAFGLVALAGNSFPCGCSGPARGKASTSVARSWKS